MNKIIGVVLRFKCTSCGQAVSVDDGQPGEAVQCGSCATVPKVPKPFEAGYIIGGFCVSEHIGSGRMGEVYKAYQETLVRDVALKFLDNDIFKNEQSIKAIQRAHELSSNEDKMIVELHKKLS